MAHGRAMKLDMLLVLADTPNHARELGRCLDANVVAVHSLEDAIEAVESRPIGVVVSELRFAGELMARVSIPVIVIAGEGKLGDAIAALRAGAADFLLEPFVPEQVAYVIGKALARHEREDAAPSAGVVLGDSRVMKQVWSVVARAAPGNATVLVRGESGTGKEVVARAIHGASSRADKPFVKIDCASLPDALLESELFGYEKGAFTGATARKPGRVELAEGGTLFLDEIGELGTAVQAKLLRLLQDREIERLGGTRTLRVDVRVVAATHRDLETMIDRGQFRQDLFYRLNVVPLWLPPLRARRSDIEVLVQHFVRAFGAANEKPNITIDAAAIKVLRGQRWPGNVRQLQNVVERLVVLSEAPTISEQAVREELSQRVRFATQPSTTQGSSAQESAAAVSVVGPLDAEMREAERRALVRALEHAGGNRTLAARLLGISRSSLYEKIAEHGLS